MPLSSHIECAVQTTHVILQARQVNIDYVVLNAAVKATPKWYTKEGHELQMGAPPDSMLCAAGSHASRAAVSNCSRRRRARQLAGKVVLHVGVTWQATERQG